MAASKYDSHKTSIIVFQKFATLHTVHRQTDADTFSVKLTVSRLYAHRVAIKQQIGFTDEI